MNYRDVFLLLVGFLAGAIGAAQESRNSMPDKLILAEHAFFDFGPPNDFYELIAVTRVGEGLHLERVLVTPEGQACMQPAKAESRTAVLHESMGEFLQGKNPCAIPEKELHHELKRCKHCAIFSGVNVTMQISCGGKERQIRTGILDQDFFDLHAGTPQNASWTMRLLEEIDKATGPEEIDQPMFAVDGQIKAEPLPETELFHALQNGSYKALFQDDATLAEVMDELKGPPPPPPSIELTEATPFAPVIGTMPKVYPPISRLARVEGVVTVQAEVDSAGKVAVKAIDGPAMLQGAATGAITQWVFPETAFGHSEEIKMRFKLNCVPHVHTSVN